MRFYVELTPLLYMRPFDGIWPIKNKTVRPVGQSRQYHACVSGGALQMDKQNIMNMAFIKYQNNDEYSDQVNIRETMLGMKA